MLKKLNMLLVGKRILFSRIFAVVLCILILVSQDRWEDNSFMDSFMEFTGLMLVCTCMLGRLWASIYISGYKSDRLITEGPYSVVRNPLYLFSLIGAAGIGLATESLVLTALIGAAFLLYYPFVVIQEEEQLARNHGEDFRTYASVTPRFFPRFSLYRQPVSYTVSLKHFQRAFLDSGIFILVYALLQIVERLHTVGVLPTLIRLP